jgi:predicted helicase
MADAESENELSGDEIVDDVGGFDLININRIDRNELERQWLNLVGDSDDEEEFEGFEAADIYQHREFDNWRKTINPRNIHEFEERVNSFLSILLMLIRSNPPTSSTISSPDNSFSLSASAILSTNFYFSLR